MLEVGPGQSRSQAHGDIISGLPTESPLQPLGACVHSRGVKILKILLKDRTLPQCPTRAELWPLQAASPEAGVLGNGVLQSHGALLTRPQGVLQGS